MIFNFLIRNSEAEKLTCNVDIRAGSQILGLQRYGTRPQTVTLTQKELKYLLENPKYAYTVVLPTLQIGDK